MSFEGGSAATSTLIPFFLGLGIVCIGLFALIVIIKIMSAIMRGVGKKKPAAEIETPAAVAQKTEPEGDMGEIKAAVSAAIATMLGDSVKGIRIVSFKKAD